jgi:hypothetical protein
MGASKVIVDGETIVDLTGDSATPETVAEGETFHDANGEPRVGTMTTAPVVQTTGDSDTAVMSQRAVTEALGNIGSIKSIKLTDDGEGNFSITTAGGSAVTLADDGDGNFTLEVI